MAHHDRQATSGKEYRLRFPAPLTVVAASEQIDALRAAKGAPWIEDARLVPLALHQPIEATDIAQASVLVLHVDPAVVPSMKRIAQVRSLRPDLPTIVALESTDIGLVRTLLRQGVSDVIGLPLQPEELLQAALAVSETNAAPDKANAGLAPLIAVARALGGGGATTLVTHLAAALAADGQNRRVCIVDLDIQFGRVAEVLGLQPRRTLADLLEAHTRVDDAFLKSVATAHASGVDVIAAPQDIVPLEAIDVEKLRRTLEIARREYDYVFVDTPSNLTHWSLSLLSEAQGVLMVVEQSLASLRQARRRLDLFDSVGIDRQMVSVIVNRVERRLFSTISLSDVAHALNHDVLCGLQLDLQNIGLAQDQGLLVGDVRSKSPYAADIRKLTGMIQQRFAAGVQP